MRDDQVENGVKFLVHPKVKSAPMSQRISFLENKGLTAEEISAALSRVEVQEAGTNDIGSPTVDNGARGNINSSGNTTAFPARRIQAVQAAEPLWRKLAVPGALVLGAAGALGTYHAASRLGAAPHSGCNTAPPSAAGGEVGVMYGGANATVAGDAMETDRTPESYELAERLADGAAYGANSGAAGLPQGYQDTAEAVSSSILTGEFRRLATTMEQQTGHLVAAVDAMKAVACRAEKDSSDLLAARVSSHTSELRAELGTIKQLLLMQAGVSGASGSGEGRITTAPGDAAAAIANGRVGPSVADASRHQGQTAGVDGRHVRGNDTAAGESDGRQKLEEDTEAAEEAVRLAIQRRKSAARAALKTLLADNAPQAAKDGIAMLRMLVANLVKQPNVPRYRRIASSNDNFKKRLLPLEGHRQMMEAIGFKAKGSLWEWTWHEDSGPSASGSNKAVLEDFVVAIDAVARPNGPPMPTSPPLTTASSGANGALASAAATPPAGVSSSAAGRALHASSTSGSGGTGGVGGRVKFEATSDEVASSPRTETSRARDVLAAAAAANQSQAGDGARNEQFSILRSAGVAPPNSADVPDREVATEAAEAGAGRGAVGQREADTGASPAAATNLHAGSGDDASVQMTMAEVAATVQRGEEPPGIRVVEDRLSADASRVGSSWERSPPKPWEATMSGAGGSRGHSESGRDTSVSLPSSLPSSPPLPPQSPNHAVAVGP